MSPTGEQKTADSALIKLKQIGTVTETIDACSMCSDGGWCYFISHCSGETEDTFLADLSVAMACDPVKADFAPVAEEKKNET